jgi:hypothetical protein
VVESGNRFHILVVIADGQMEEEEPTVAGRDGLSFYLASNKQLGFQNIPLNPKISLRCGLFWKLQCMD